MIDAVRVIKPIRTQTKGVKPLNYDGIYPSMRNPEKKKEAPANTLAIYTFLSDVEYQVRAHFEWNLQHPDLAQDRNEGKHYAVARRMLDRGGRQDVFLGTRDCHGYVEPCEFGSDCGAYDKTDSIDHGLSFHGFDYPDETGEPLLRARFWRPVMEHGVIHFPRPEQCDIRKDVRPMEAKQFGQACVRSVESEASDLKV